MLFLRHTTAQHKRFTIICYGKNHIDGVNVQRHILQTVIVYLSSNKPFHLQ